MTIRKADLDYVSLLRQDVEYFASHRNIYDRPAIISRVRNLLNLINQESNRVS